jgi:phage terminase large subunit GpA-like protein
MKYQVSALEEIEHSPTHDLATTISEELADYARSSHGEQVIRHVAPMSLALPAAESALGNAVAAKVAELLGAELCPGVKFTSSSAEGSHSAAGETQQFSESTTRSISGPLLLTDIHFSSVRNWEKAVATSKPAFSPIYGVTWIA